MEIDAEKEEHCENTFPCMKVFWSDIYHFAYNLVPTTILLTLIYVCWLISGTMNYKRILMEFRCNRIDLFVENIDFGNISNFEENDVVTVGALNLNLTITNPCPKYSLHFHRFEVHLISLEDDQHATFVMADYYVPSSSSLFALEIRKNDGVSVEIIFNSSTSRMPAQEWFHFQSHKNGSKLLLFQDSTLMPLQLGVDVRALLTVREEERDDELAWIRASCGSLNDIIVNVNNNNGFINGTAKLCHSSFIL